MCAVPNAKTAQTNNSLWSEQQLKGVDRTRSGCVLRRKSTLRRNRTQIQSHIALDVNAVDDAIQQVDPSIGKWPTHGLRE